MYGRDPWNRPRVRIPTAQGAPISGKPVAPVPPLQNSHAVLSDEGDHLLLRLPLPPVSPENLDIEVSDRQVTVRGQHKESTELKGGGFYRSARKMGSFFYTIALPVPVLPETAQAGLEEGVLFVSLPKRQE